MNVTEALQVIREHSFDADSHAILSACDAIESAWSDVQHRLQELKRRVELLEEGLP